MTNSRFPRWTWLYLAACIVSTSWCFSQNQVQDSLLARHLDKSLPDTARMRALLELGESDYRKDSLLYYHQQYDEVFKQSESPTDLLEHHLQLGGSYFSTHQASDALHHYTIAKTIAIALGDTIKLLQALSGQASAQSVNYRNYESIETAQEGLNIARRIGDGRLVCRLQGNIALNFIMMKNFDQGIPFYQDNISCKLEQGDILSANRAMYALGLAYYHKGEYEQALLQLTSAMELAEEKGYVAVKAAVLTTMGQARLKLGQFSESKKILEQALKLSRQTQQPVLIADSQLGLAKIYQSTQIDSALLFAQQALQLGKQTQALNVQVDANKLLLEIYQERGQNRLALEHQSQWKILEDSMFRIENQRAVLNWEYQLEYQQKQDAEKLAHEEELAQQELAAQRHFYLLLEVSALIIIVLLSLLRLLHERVKEERQLLLHQIDLLKEQVVACAVSATGVAEELKLKREQIEEHLGQSLGDSSWTILSMVFENPSISNQEIADKVYLSLEGVSSSLRRMYKVFRVESKSKHNMKVALITKVAMISLSRDSLKTVPNYPKYPQSKYNLVSDC